MSSFPLISRLKLMITYMETKNSQTRFISVDTSALISFFNPNDSNHDLATSLLESLADQLVVMVTPVDAYSETMNTLWKKLGRATAVTVAEYLAGQSQFLLVDTAELMPASLEKFKTATGGPSFVDSVVMATADKFETKEIFGFDECFRKNGYALP
jgi:predicted nucleic acid-binding protein